METRPPTQIQQSKDVCGGAPVVADESLVGEIQGQAQTLSKLLGEASLAARIETSRRDVFSRYPNAGERANAYFEYLVCILLMQDNSLTAVQKIEQLKIIRREFRQ